MGVTFAIWNHIRSLWCFYTTTFTVHFSGINIIPSDRLIEADTHIFKCQGGYSVISAQKTCVPVPVWPPLYIVNSIFILEMQIWLCQCWWIVLSDDSISSVSGWQPVSARMASLAVVKCAYLSGHVALPNHFPRYRWYSISFSSPFLFCLVYCCPLHLFPSKEPLHTRCYAGVFGFPLLCTVRAYGAKL